jgi:hypothetical protein
MRRDLYVTSTLVPLLIADRIIVIVHVKSEVYKKKTLIYVLVLVPTCSTSISYSA